MATFLMYGFDDTAQSAARVLETNGHTIAAAVQPDAPRMHLAEYGFKSDGPVLGEFLYKSIDCDIDVAIHTLPGELSESISHYYELLRRGLPVVSTCEELTYPGDYRSSPEFNNIIELAQRKKVPLVPAGANPGFVMDVLPRCFLTALNSRPSKIEINRSLDATKRQQYFLDRVGIGSPITEFKGKKVREVGHRGLHYSAQYLADQLKLGFMFDPRETISADWDEATGIVRGVHQTVKLDGPGTDITLEYQAGLGYKDEDRYRFELSDGDVFTATTSGFHGDKAKTAQLVSVALGVVECGSHLRGLIRPDEAPRVLPWERLTR